MRYDNPPTRYQFVDWKQQLQQVRPSVRPQFIVDFDDVALNCFSVPALILLPPVGLCVGGRYEIKQKQKREKEKSKQKQNKSSPRQTLTLKMQRQ